MDEVLHAERLADREKRTHDMRLEDLPDGVFVAMDGAAHALRGAHVLRWSESGYCERITRPRGIARVLTPPSIVAALSAGYRPHWHPATSSVVPHELVQAHRHYTPRPQPCPTALVSAT